ncbi:MAG: phospholipase D-like domain-containing protein [Armatimonadota bacterium]
MREKHANAGLTVNAIAGTHVVLLGLNLSAAKRKGCLGFAIQREDHTREERYWMRGMKTFEATDPNPDPGALVSSREHPFQSFQWADYSAKPGYDYTYTVVPLYGTPESLKEGDAVSVRIQTEKESGSRHIVFFNRGAVSSQQYAREFQNRRPDAVGERAYTWLSRGLHEALLLFIGQAKGAAYGLYGAVYEFQWQGVLSAIKAAKGSGADVRIIIDAIPGGRGPLAKNTDAIAKAKIKGLVVHRTQGKIMHNKFFVLTKNNKPIAVWTGSTNLTENGIFGHSNCGHVVEDADVARAYLDYWQELKKNVNIKDWIETDNVAPPDPWSEDTTVVFSPRRGLKALDWYAQIAGGAKKGLFMTFAFGMHEKFKQVYEQDDGVLRFALMEKEGNGAGLEQGRKDIRRIRKLPNVIVAVGNSLRLNAFDRWLAERAKLTAEANVKWVHTKYMLVDPLGDHPIVVTGSANFSKPSTDTNDENMLVIRNDRRIADIYMGEFMRLHTHYAFREAVAITLAKDGPEAEWQPKYLKVDEHWQADYFDESHPRFLRREYFAGL